MADNEFYNLSVEELTDVMNRVSDALISSDETSTYDTSAFAKHHFLIAYADLEKAINNLQLAQAFMARELSGNF